MAHPRDNAEIIQQRLENIRARTVRAYATIEQWNPNDRPLKVVRAHIENIDAYLNEVEREISKCTQSNRSSSRSRKRT